ncbi:hypothetical protein NX059_004507 [Plenodomus lindquistii]|nr:hypothetical protein NX059_004507 [Plenodomus lindquistii]
MFDTPLVTLIALQLLASCSTFLPPSSAENLPLYQQRTEHKLVSALQLHTQYCHAPAAGHHARAPSESAPWPGLCALPAATRTLMDRRNHNKRRINGSGYAYTPTFSGSGWTDGVAPGMMREETAPEDTLGQSSPHATESALPSSINRRTCRWEDLPNSTPEAEPTSSCLSKLPCQPCTLKSQKHKQPGTSIITRLFKRIPAPSDHDDYDSGPPPVCHKQPSKLQQITRFSPSAIRLRRTQLAPP